jgi:hypothetical protein
VDRAVRGLPGFTRPSTGAAFQDRGADWFRVNDDGLIFELRANVANNLDRTYHFEGQISAFIAEHGITAELERYLDDLASDPDRIRHTNP